jgi:hypothetical protein
LTAWRTTLDLNETGGYILIQKDSDCSTTTVLYALLRQFAGVYDTNAMTTGHKFGYIPEESSIE